jgi:hypothetical protein
MDDQPRVLRGLPSGGAVQTDDVGRCPCGSAWFELKGAPPFPGGAVSIDESGAVTGRYGALHCVECGAEWLPPRGRFRSVGLE